MNQLTIQALVERIRPIQLLWMPSPESLKALGDAAGIFTDGYWGDDTPDGNLLLAPSRSFSRADLSTALSAGGKMVEGYEFPYPRSVEIMRAMPSVVEAGKVAVRGWCGYETAGIGYALDREVAIAVCAASSAARDDEDED